MIRLLQLEIGEEEIRAVAEVLRSGMLVQGERVAAFEAAVAARTGTPHAVAMTSGTAALHTALLALGVGAGDVVVVTPYSWVATANAILFCGAKPVFADIDPRTFNMAPAALEVTLEQLKQAGELPRVKAVLPIHAFGLMADMPALMQIANAYGVPVVEDAACALGATCGGRPAGSMGVMGCFSFHPRKAVTTGEGGAVTTADAELAVPLRRLRNHGQERTARGTCFPVAGLNYRMTEMQAAMGVVQLDKFDNILAMRRAKADEYATLLAETDFLPPAVPNGWTHPYQSYVVLLPPDTRRDAMQTVAYAREQGVELSIGTCHIPLTDTYRQTFGFRLGDFPVTDDVYRRAVTLPLHRGLSPEDQRMVVDVLKRAVRG